MARAPKSFRADGTPKKRWSAQQRAARGGAARRRGGRVDENAPLNRKQRRALQFAEYDWREAKERQPREEPKFNPRWDDRGERRKPGRKQGDGRRFNDGESRGRSDDRRRTDERDDRRERPDRRRFDDRGERKERRRFDDRGERKERRRFDDRPDHKDRRRTDDREGHKDRRRFNDRDRDDRGRGGRERHERHDRHDRRDERRGRPDRHDRNDRRDRREHHRDETPVSDQMAWSATQVDAVEGVTNGFNELGVAPEIVGVLAAQGITEPFAIQEATIRDAIAGHDVLGRARTGSGKTLAFGLPLLTRLADKPGAGPRAVILSPTRELAMQIADNLAPLAAAVKLELTLVAGGMNYNPQIRAFERGVDVVVATPGRLIDLMEQGAADLSNVEISVLDEADHMAEMGFTEEVTAILDATPAGGQRLLFSATLDEAVDRLVTTYMSDPVTHEVDSGQASVTTMTHAALQTKPHHKQSVTAEIASRDGKTLVFARTQRGTDRIAGQLRDAGVMAGALHGGLTQGARARILAAFKSGDVPVLVATDVAARGIHVDDVTLVLQVDPPRDAKDYLHRAGRTARAGHDGTVATIVLPHQRKLMRRILGQAGVEAQQVETMPESDELADLTGARPAGNEPVDEADYQALIAPKAPARKRGRGPRRFGRRR